MKKGEAIWVFLERARKVGADMAAKGDNSKRDWARISVDDLMCVRGDIIVPHVRTLALFRVYTELLTDYVDVYSTTTSTTSSSTRPQHTTTLASSRIPRILRRPLPRIFCLQAEHRTPKGILASSQQPPSSLPNDRPLRTRVFQTLILRAGLTIPA